MKPLWFGIFRVREVRNKLFITLGLLAIYRFLTYVPLPGVQPFLLAEVSADPNSPDLVTGFLNLLSGGAYSRLSILALGIYPFSLANGFLKFFTVIFPGLQRRLEEDPREGRRILNLWAYILTAPAALFQAYFLFFGPSASCPLGPVARFNFRISPLSAITILFSLTAGTYLLIWISELISSKGVNGEGFNAIVFSGAAIVLFEDMYKFWQGPQGTVPLPFWQGISSEAVHWLGVGTYILALLLGLVIIVYLTLGRREIPVMYPGRRIGNRMSMPPKAILPIHLTWTWHSATEAQSLLAFPLLISLFFICSPINWLQQAALSVQSTLQPDSLWAGPLLALTILLFAPFLADASFAEQNYAENLKRAGAQIPGVHSGAATQVYLQRIFRRVNFYPTFLAVFVLLIPWIINITFGVDALLLAGEALFLILAFTRNALLHFEAELKLRGYQEKILVRY